MKIARQDVAPVAVDEALTILPLFDGSDFRFDCVIGALNGTHPRHINMVSDRIYFILSGTFIVTVDDTQYDAATHDTIIIPKNSAHGIEGTGEFLIITAPPFAPENERDA